MFHKNAVSQAVPEVTVHNCHLLRVRKMQRQPLDEPLHGWNDMGFHSSILLCPGINLLLNVITCNEGTKALREQNAYKELSEEIYKRNVLKQSNS